MIIADTASAIENHEDDYDYSLAQLEAEFGSTGVVEKDIKDWMLA